MNKVTEGQAGWLARLLRSLCGCCLDSSSNWRFERAMEPTDINWENLGVGPFQRFCQTLISYFITSIILSICGVIIWQIKRASNAYKENNKIGPNTDYRQ